MTIAAEQKQVRRFLQLDRWYASRRPTDVRTEATMLISKAITVRAAQAICHATTIYCKNWAKQQTTDYETTAN